MKIVVTYDIDTSNTVGRKRLIKIAAKCMDRGVRVQNSVFECELNAAQLRDFQKELEALMDSAADRVLMYNLGNAWEGKCIRLGKKSELPTDVFIL